MTIEKLISKNKKKLSQTDLTIAEFILNNKGVLDQSINDLAKLCFTSRTSVLRFSKKLGFNGYSELKFYINKDRNAESIDESKIKEDLSEIFEKLINTNNIFIYGNGQYEEVLCSSIKLYLKDFGQFSESYQGRDELSTFNKKLLENSTIFVIDLSKDQYALELLSIISNIDCLKILISDGIKNAFLCDYFINLEKIHDKSLNLITKNLGKIEDFFKKYREFRISNES
ncbi:MurR/RpiR family transcriptional regulator [Anaerococcus porci]|uniref:MurR/RpiR family transcriptional regulator n=1 Tax=Anaerococcus porci TaxID=2652269 RepID=UPI002A74A3C6|nr:MurR/RpiR family transcriptional regulator [Anaerococcus porci]MDY3005653.1 MurR/RpiR family transcriptional regulator [Anaerococcus porci]